MPLHDAFLQYLDLMPVKGMEKWDEGMPQTGKKLYNELLENLKSSNGVRIIIKGSKYGKQKQ